MKIKLILICFIILSVINNFTWSAEGSSPKEDQGEEIVVTTDGFAILMGVYNPFDEDMKGIYGSSFSLSTQYCLNMGRSIDLLASIGFVHKNGNPFYDDLTFTSDNISTITFFPIEISARKRFIFMKNPTKGLSRGLYIGGGINYIRAREKINEKQTTSGGDFGTHFFAGPQIFLNDNLAFEGDVKLLFNNIDMKHGSTRYSIMFSGLMIKAGLAWYY
ncbi:TPA: hypothetical protein ENX78_01055 [Candidatus Poribacteria bacterium]|nr:hypothetical protein [Candidatus Poribacteria bacterium]